MHAIAVDRHDGQGARNGNPVIAQFDPMPVGPHRVGAHFGGSDESADDGMERIFITRNGFDAARSELDRLLTTDRPTIIRAISEARAHGDLKENAEYHAAKDRQAFIEARISELKSLTARAEVVEIGTLSGSVKFGATVTIRNDDTDEVDTYQIVSEYEADTRRGRISVKTAVARALMGKDIGATVEVNTPRGEATFTVLDIQYKSGSDEP